MERRAMVTTHLTDSPNYSWDTVDTSVTDRGSLFDSSVDSLFAVSFLERVSHQVATLKNSEQVVDELLRLLKIEVQIDEVQLTKIPAKGALCIICDQPLGTVEALVIHHLVRRRRPDVKIFANMLLSGFPRMHEAAEFIDPGWRLASRVRNVLSLKSALRFLSEGNVVGPLPIDSTALFDREPWHVVDPTWRQSVASVLRESGSTLLPVSFGGTENALQGLASLLTFDHNWNASKQAASQVRIEIGRPIRSAELQRFPHAEQLEAFLRDRCDMLKLRADATRSSTKRTSNRLQPIADSEDPTLLATEIDSLPEAQKLVRQRGKLVAYARGAQCPHLLNELGRLRQIAFRAVGEGTAESRDLDHFDQIYDHLFVWNEQSDELIGAYRLGRLDALRSGESPYSATLFHYSPNFFSELGPALELGRSFVRPEYQRSPAGLMMLWKGIAEYLHRSPPAWPSKYQRGVRTRLAAVHGAIHGVVSLRIRVV